jgi:hypothetical protein
VAPSDKHDTLLNGHTLFINFINSFQVLSSDDRTPLQTPSTSYQLPKQYRLTLNISTQAPWYEIWGRRSGIANVTESENKMEAPRSLEASGTSRATKQRHFLYLQLHYSIARRSIVLDAVCTYRNTLNNRGLAFHISKLCNSYVTIGHGTPRLSVTWPHKAETA